MIHTFVHPTNVFEHQLSKVRSLYCQEETSYGKWQLTVSQKREEQKKKKTKRKKDNNQTNKQIKSLVYRNKCVATEKKS